MEMQANYLASYEARGSLPYNRSMDPYAPDYRETDFSRLIAASDGGHSPSVFGGVNLTMVKIKQAALMSLPQVKPLAKWLRSEKSNEQTFYNVWNFLKTKIKYKLDPAGFEQVRLAARSWRDRATGVDCEDFAIFAYALLKNLGFDPKLKIVAFNNKKNFGHIYTVVRDPQTGKKFVVDAVMDLFNKEPANVTKQMEIQVYSGVASLASAMGDSDVGAMPTSHRSNWFAQRLTHWANKPMPTDNRRRNTRLRALRILTWAANLEKSGRGLMAKKLFSLVYDISKKGNLVFKPRVSKQLAADYAAALHVRHYILNRPQLRGTEDLGALDAELKGMEADVISGDFEGLSGKVKNFFKKVGKGLKKAARFALLKANPVTILARNSFLLIVRLNLFKIANRLWLGYLSQEDAKEIGIPPELWSKSVSFRQKIEKVFYAFGGEKKNLKRAATKGARKLRRDLGMSGLAGVGAEDIFGDEYAGSDLEAVSGVEDNFNGSDTEMGRIAEILTGIGAAPLAAAAAAAAPIIAKVTAIALKFKPFFKAISKAIQVGKKGAEFAKRRKERKAQEAQAKANAQANQGQSGVGFAGDEELGSFWDKIKNFGKKIKGSFKKVGEKFKKIFKKKGANAPAEPVPGPYVPPEAQGKPSGDSGGSESGGEQSKGMFANKAIKIAVGLAVAGGLAYLAFR